MYVNVATHFSSIYKTALLTREILQEIIFPEETSVTQHKQHKPEDICFADRVFHSPASDLKK